MQVSRSYEDILAWQKAHNFVIEAYRAIAGLPEYDRFGLCSQFRRAAVSIPANIAEGYKKMGKSDKLRFFNIAQGSLEDCRYYCLLAKDLNYIDGQRYLSHNDCIEEAIRFLNSYIKGVVNNNGVSD